MTTTTEKNLGGRPHGDVSRGRALNRSFAVYRDQIDAVAAVAKEDGHASVSAALRVLIDESLKQRAARLARNAKRRKR